MSDKLLFSSAEKRYLETNAEFFRDAQASLEPFQPGLFDGIIDQ
jgi:hypothetical protein